MEIYICDRSLDRLSHLGQATEIRIVDMLILLMRSKGPERLNNLPRVTPLIRGRARVGCTLGVTSKPVFFEAR